MYDSVFDKARDEWVKMENVVRERSIPLERSECGIVEWRPCAVLSGIFLFIWSI